MPSNIIHSVEAVDKVVTEIDRTRGLMSSTSLRSSEKDRSLTNERVFDSGGVERVTVVVGQGDGTASGCIWEPASVRLDVH